MGLPQGARSSIAIILLFILAAWIVELFGVFYLQRSCREHRQLYPELEHSMGSSMHELQAHHNGTTTGTVWPAGAQLPATMSCSKTYRYIWWSIWFEFPIVVGLGLSLLEWLRRGDAHAMQRYRLGWLSWLATCTALQMWAANVMLNLTDTIPADEYETATEITRAKVAFVGFVCLSVLNLLLMLVLGDEGTVDEAGREGYTILRPEGDRPGLVARGGAPVTDV